MMGIIQKQAIRGTIYSYIGVGVGFLTSGILFPKYLTPEVIGLLSLVVSYSVIFSQFGSLGFGGVINRLFPYFRDKETGHQGFLIIALGISFIGFVLVIIVLEFMRPMIIRHNIKNSALFIEYFVYLPPLIFFTLFFNLFDTYTKALYQAVIGTVMKEVVQRLLILVFIFLYILDLINLRSFIILYIVALCLPTIFLLIFLIIKDEFKIRKPQSVFTSALKREMFYICLHGLLIGLGVNIIPYVNTILVNKFMGLSQTGVFTIAFYFGTIILIPSRPLVKIASTILADSWKSNNLDNIKMIYQKSCVIQAFASILLFILLWVNIDNVFHVTGSVYESGKWVIFFIGLTNVVEMSTGINAMIIQTSASYRINTIITMIFLIFLVVSNIILIPLLGLTGAALGTLISNSATNFIRFAFLKRKFNMQPFDNRILLLIGFGGISYLAGYLIPDLNDFILDIGLKSAVTGFIFIFLVLRFNISEDVNGEVNRILGRK